MERIDDLLRRAGGQDQGAFTAARVIDACNRALRATLAIDEVDARATSVREGTIVVEVGHSAIAGRIRIAQKRILNETNQLLGARWPNTKRPTRIVTRIG